MAHLAHDLEKEERRMTGSHDGAMPDKGQRLSGTNDPLIISEPESSPHSVLRRCIDGLSVVTAILAATSVAVIMLSIVADVFLREFFGASIRGVFEYSEMLMVIVVYFSLGYAQFMRSHVDVDLLAQRLPERISVFLQLIVLTAVGVLLLWMTFETLRAATESFERAEERFGMVRVPLWPARFALPIGFFAMATQCFKQAYDARTHYRHIRTVGPGSSLDNQSSER